jgi:zinc protease
MRTCFCWLCILSTILALALLGENAQAQHPDYKTKKLKNGLEIIVVENHMVPLATVELVARNGGFTESPEFSGLSHLYEHMFFKANETYPSQAAFLEGLQSLGASLGVSNATTGTEDVNYFIIIPKRNLARGFEFMSEAIRTPLFDTAEIRKERYVVLGEFDRNEASPLFRIRYAMDSAIWSPELFSRKEQLGLRSTILSATPELMHTIQHRFYVPNNMALIVAGDVDANTVFAQAEKYFGMWERGENPFPKWSPPAFPPIKKQLVVREAAGIPYAYVQVTWQGPSMGKQDDDTYAADVFSTIIDQPNSRFQKKLVESRMAYQVGMSYYSQQNVGPIDIRMFAPVGSTKKSIKAMMDEVADFDAADYFSDEELETAKQILQGDRIYEQESASAFATRALPLYWASAGLDYYTNYIDNVKKVTRADIKRYIDRYINDQPYVMGVAASQDNLSKLALDPKEVLQ